MIKASLTSGRRIVAESETQWSLLSSAQWEREKMRESEIFASLHVFLSLLVFD